MNVQLVLEILFNVAILAGAAYLHVDRAWQKTLELRRWLTTRS